uniref:C2 domain-containing protein n=1 Tax=Rhabditophanes sp. KR3021 TaxID=114890 RepID=A0AC35TXG6_9BILA
MEYYYFRIKPFEYTDVTLRKQYQLNFTFYDTERKVFFGENKVTKAITPPRNNFLDWKEHFFFYGGFGGRDVVVAIELVELNAPTNIESGPNEVTVGWGVFKFNGSLGLHEYGSKAGHETLIHLYEGTPLILMYMDLDNMENENIKKLQTNFTVIVQSCKALSKLTKFFPQFQIISQKDVIPGIGNIETFEIKPQIVGILENISISFPDGDSIFETLILNRLNYENCLKEDIKYDPQKHNSYSVLERRLKIGVHNGLMYVSKPFTIKMSGEESFDSKEQWLDKSMFKFEEESIEDFVPANFIIPAGITLSNLVSDPNIDVIFSVEYLVGYKPVNQKETYATKVIKYSWGVWQPFGKSNKSSVSHVMLTGGPRPNPEESIYVKSFLGVNEDNKPILIPSMTIKFRFKLDNVVLEKSSVRTIVKPVVVEETMSEVDFNESKVEREVLRQIENAPKKSHLYEETFIRPGKETFLKDQRIQVFDDPTLETKILIPTSTNYSRKDFEFFNSYKFPAYYDYMNQPPKIVDTTVDEVFYERKEELDNLVTNEITIEFMGINFFQNKLYDPVEKKYYFFTFQFYRFKEVVTEKLSIFQKFSSISEEPFVLQRVDSNDMILKEVNSGLQIKFTIDSSPYLNGRPTDFIEYLRTSNLSIDVWDGLSLIHLGTAIVPLKHLCRQGLPAITTCQKAAIIQNGLEEQDTTIGSIYLNLSNIGKPTLTSRLVKPHSDGINQSSRLVTSTKIPLHVYAQVHAIPMPIPTFAPNLGQDEKWIEGLSGIKMDSKDLNIDRLPESIKAKVLESKMIYDEEIVNYQKTKAQSKADMLLKTAFKGITTNATLFVPNGEATFFEFELENIQTVNVDVAIHINDIRLEVVENASEWSSLKKEFNVSGNVEKDMFHRNSNNDLCVYFKPMEKVKIPFKYSEYIESAGPEFTSILKVIFIKEKSRTTMSILELTIHSASTYIHRSLRFFARQEQGFQRLIPINNAGSKDKIVALKCSNSKAACSIKNPAISPYGQNLFIKLHPDSTEAESISSFVICFYQSSQYTKVVEAWRIYIHFIPSLTVNTIMGQVKNFSLRFKCALNDKKMNYKVNSSSKAVRIFPEGVYQVANIEKGEAICQVIPFIQSDQVNFVSMVSTTPLALKSLYLLDIKVQEPNIVKVYNLSVTDFSSPTMIEKIPVLNPYGETKIFRVFSSNLDQIQVLDDLIQISPGKVASVRLKFFLDHTSVNRNHQTLIFVENTDNGAQEEAYRMQVLFKE